MLIDTDKWTITDINLTPYFQAVEIGDKEYQRKYIDNLIKTYGYTNIMLLANFIKNHKQNDPNTVFIIGKSTNETIKEEYQMHYDLSNIEIKINAPIEWSIIEACPCQWCREYMINKNKEYLTKYLYSILEFGEYDKYEM